MKKNLWTGFLAAAIAFSIGSTNALAAEPQSFDCPGRCSADGTWVSFVDRDSSCDNFAPGACGDGYGHRTGGQGGHHQSSRRSWYIVGRERCGDTDGHGVCDHPGPGTWGGGYCGGSGRQGRGQGGRRR